jgi:hypothetical protein
MSSAKDRRRKRREHLIAASLPPNEVTPGAAARRPSRLELDAFIKRFPQPSRAALGFTLAGVLIGNGYLLWQIVQGVLPLSGLVLLVLAEAVLLSLLTGAHRQFVPAEQRMADSHMHYGLPDTITTWAAALIGVGGFYAVWALVLNETEVLRLYLSSVAPWKNSGLHVALGITLLFAMGGMVADQLHFRRAGPPFVSSVQLEAATRRTTLLYGVIVVAIPTIGGTLLAIRGASRLIGKRDSESAHLLGGLIVIGTFFGIAYALTSAMRQGPLGWAAVYLLGKLMVEMLFALMPVLAQRAAGHAGD